MSQHEQPAELKRTLGLYSAAAIVAGSMVGSGIFLTTPMVARQIETTGLMLGIWVLTGILTILGATSYGKLAAHMPEAGGQYVFLREAWGKIPAFLYGWVFFWVIQTGFLAAVSVAFSRYVGVLVPSLINMDALFIMPFNLPMTTEKILAVVCLIALTVFNSFGVHYGALLQNFFTSLKVLGLLLLIILGLALGQNLMGGSEASVLDWSMTLPEGGEAIKAGFFATVAVAAVGPLFSSDAWNYVTFIGGEVKDAPKVLPKALVLGATLVVILYLLVNVAYVNVLSLEQIQTVPDDKVAAMMMEALFGHTGALVIAVIILVSTFGCLNGLLLAGARVFYSMAKDGLLFRKFGEVHPETKSPNFSLWAQCVWAIGLTLSGTYGTLLSYIVFTSLVFYIVTMAGLLKMALHPSADFHMKNPLDYAVPIFYIIGALILSAFMLLSPETMETSLIGVGFTLTGLPVYLLWQRMAQRKKAAL